MSDYEPRQNLINPVQMPNKKQKSLEQYKNQLSVNVKYLLSLYSMNMMELSKRINAAYGSVYDIVEGKANPTLSTLFKISEYFDLSIEGLIGDSDISKNLEKHFIQQIPMIKWEEITRFLDGELEIENELITISSKKELSSKSFILPVNTKTESLFKNGTLLVFDIIDSEFKNFDNQFVLISSSDNIHSLKKLLAEDNQIFLQSINPEIPIQKLNKSIKITAHLVQAKLELR